MNFSPLVAASLLAAFVTFAEADTGSTTNAVAPAPEPTIVTSGKLNVDYLHNVGTFEGNVLVIDPKITVRADQMVVYFGENKTPGATNLVNRSLQKIEAHGGVVITADDKKAAAENATYTAADGKVVLTGKPQVDGPDGVVSGNKITFWRDQKKMDVEASTRLILFPDEKKAEEPKPIDTPPAPSPSEEKATPPPAEPPATP